MLTEKQIRKMYDTAVDTLRRRSTEITIDVQETAAAMVEKTLAKVLETPHQDFRKKTI